MICGNCPLILVRGDRYYCERNECEINPNEECIDEEEEATE